MASDNEKESNLLICPVCSQEYKSPKLISCGHSVCMEPCLQKILQSHCPTCPVCKTEIQCTSSASAESFPSNLVLEALLKGNKIALEDINIPVKRKLCQLHEETLDKFCETCSELICEKCVTETHDQLHNITSLQEAAKKHFDGLEGIEQELRTADERLGKISEILEAAKLKYQTDADSIGKEISEAEARVIQFVRNSALDLSSKLAERNENVAKLIKNAESKRAEKLLLSGNIKNACESLKSQPQSISLKSLGLVENLSRKTAKLLTDISLLEETNFPHGIGLCFKTATSNFQGTCVGTLETNRDTSQENGSLQGCKMWTCSEISSMCTENLSGAYKGFAWAKESSDCFFVYIIKQHYLARNEKSKYCWSTSEDISIISPTTDITGHSILGHSETYIYKISCDRYSSVSDVLNTQENKISAVCWDENQTGCYVLLTDGKTIIGVRSGEFMGYSGGSVKRISVTLDEPVTSVTSRQFHVGELGGMAICETKKKRIRYYEGVQAKATKIVTAPPDINGWYPVFVTTRRRDQRWFVVWETLSYDIEKDGVPYARIYQYNENFCLEGLRFKIACSRIRAFSFSEGDCDKIEVRKCGLFCNGANTQVAIELIPYQSTRRTVSVYTIGEA